jgi:hypothetical protein
MHLLLTLLFCFSLGQPLAYVKRFTYHTLNSTKPPPSLPNVIDAGHAAMLAVGAPKNIFTQADADKLDADSLAHFAEWFGLNFSIGAPGVIYNATNNQRILVDGSGPLATMVPFKEENDFEIRLIIDNKHLERGILGGWVQVVYTNLVVYLRGGAVPATAKAFGQVYQPNYALTYGISVYLNTRGNLSKKRNVEKFKMRSTMIGSGAVNARGHFEYGPTVELTDEDGNVGFYIDKQLVDFRWGVGYTGNDTRASGDIFVFPY